MDTTPILGKLDTYNSSQFMDHKGSSWKWQEQMGVDTECQVNVFSSSGKGLVWSMWMSAKSFMQNFGIDQIKQSFKEQYDQ